jgi:hypothetical protein
MMGFELTRFLAIAPNLQSRAGVVDRYESIVDYGSSNFLALDRPLSLWTRGAGYTNHYPAIGSNLVCAG